MKKSKLLFLSLLLIFTKGFTQSTDAFSEENQSLERLASEQQIIGATAGYSIDGETKWTHSTGYSDLEKKISFNDRTLTRVASIAKPMTAIAMMQLVEQELVDLDLPIQTYLPDFPKQKKGMITLRHLLSHSSGIPGYKNVKEAETKESYRNLEEAVNVFKDRKLRFEPGSAFYYTSYGYVVLGLIIEKVSGLTFEEYMQKNIWDKADMQDTGVEKFDAEYENKSQLYHFEKGKTQKGEKNNLSNRIPGGGFYTTQNDLIKFGNAVLNNLFIQETTLNSMVEINSLKKDGNPYGFGWFLYAQSPHQNVVIGHGGEQTGTASQIMINRSSKTVVVVLSNTSGTWKEVITLTGKLMGMSKSNGQ